MKRFDMSKKYTYESIKEYIESFGYQLVSTEYVNQATKLLMICNKNHTCSISFHNFKNGYRCRVCSYEKRTLNQTFTYEYVKNFIEVQSNSGYKLLSKNYNKASDKLEFMCDKGHIYSAIFSSFRQGKRCPFCSGRSGIDLEFIKNEFNKRNLVLLETEYINDSTKLRFICNNHKEKGIQKVTWNQLKYMNACKYCNKLIAKEKISGSNHYLWNNGITTLTTYLRKQLINWKLDVIDSCHYKCVILGSDSDLKIHHLNSFNKIIKKIISENCFNIYPTIGEYQQDELKLIVDRLLKEHEIDIGIVLESKVHELYHKLYKFDNNKNQFKEFVTRLENGEFNNYLEEHQLKLNINYSLLEKILK